MDRKVYKGMYGIKKKYSQTQTEKQRQRQKDIDKLKQKTYIET